MLNIVSTQNNFDELHLQSGLQYYKQRLHEWGQ